MVRYLQPVELAETFYSLQTSEQEQQAIARLKAAEAEKCEQERQAEAKRAIAEIRG